MLPPADASDVIHYRCNICGARQALATNKFHRELAQCGGCGATARFRGIVLALAQGLGVALDLPLRQWPARRELRGLGMSDWPGYADLLAAKFQYTNTFFDRPPRLDILAPDAELLEAHDFVISSDVLEHVAPPVQRAFDHLYRLLKPGGHLVFSVPYSRVRQTVEHFPDLWEYGIYDFHGGKILVNRTRGGTYQVYDDLFFHGGEGATLEMRVFCEADVLAHLRAAGFTNIKVYDKAVPAVGYYWPAAPGHTRPDAPLLYAYIISAQRPAC